MIANIERSVTSILADYASNTRLADLPRAVVDATRRSVVDTVALARAGSSARGVAIARKIWHEEGGAPQASLWDSRVRIPMAHAAGYNSLCAAAPDYDGLHPRALVHPGTVTVPAALAAGQWCRADGARVLCAVAVADELMCRMGLAHTTNRGWYLTAVYGGPAAAIAAALTMGLNRDEIANAIGLALSTAFGTQQAMAERSLAKRMQVAAACSAGVRAARLAAAGYEGMRYGFEGPQGVYAVLESGDPGALLRDLGSRFECLSVCQKAYPCCACSHAVLDGLLTLVQDADLRPDDVTEVVATISPYMGRLVGQPFSHNADPEVMAQFSLQYAASCVLLWRRFGLAEQDSLCVLDPRVATLASRVRIVVDPANTGGVVPAEVSVTLADGRQLKRRVTQLRGMPEQPFADGQLREKARLCFTYGAHGLSDEAAENAIRAMSELEKVADVNTLFPESDYMPEVSQRMTSVRSCPQ